MRKMIAENCGDSGGDMGAAKYGDPKVGNEFGKWCYDRLRAIEKGKPEKQFGTEYRRPRVLLRNLDFIPLPLNKGYSIGSS